MRKKRSPARLLGFETSSQPLISRWHFIGRVAGSFVVSSLLIGISLFAGMVGYHTLEQMTWIDSFANAAMILSGMGPLAPMQTFGGKLFAGLYALYSGLALILAAGITLSPVVHRFLHRFHLDGEEDA